MTTPSHQAEEVLFYLALVGTVMMTGGRDFPSLSC